MTDKKNLNQEKPDVRDKKTILVIDDDDCLLVFLEKFIETLGHKSVTKSTAKDAMKWLDGNKIDLILVDVMLPDTLGIEFAKWINTKENLKNVPVIMMTAIMHDQITRETSMLSGARDFIVKPIDLDNLKEKIKIFLKD